MLIRTHLQLQYEHLTIFHIVARQLDIRKCKYLFLSLEIKGNLMVVFVTSDRNDIFY